MKNSLIAKFSEKQEQNLLTLFGEEQLAVLRHARKNKYDFLLLNCYIPGPGANCQVIVKTDEPMPMFQIMKFDTPEEFEKFDLKNQHPYAMVQGYNMAICYHSCLHEVERDPEKFPYHLNMIMESTRQATEWYKQAVLDKAETETSKGTIEVTE